MRFRPDAASQAGVTMPEDVRSRPEPFVSAEVAAAFVGIKRRQLLELARRGIAGAYPLGTGAVRNIWVFRLSELAGAITARKSS
jgi:hypothetical protein